ncbi:MAG: rhomboid family intramembrane serine protease [Oscillospiraceae bacterium]|nr:rhomboid family intramembrane serine protease [Oscillospiraceae bacterium]
MLKKRVIIYNAPVILTYTIVALIILIVGLVTDNRTTYALFSVYRGSWAQPLTYFRLFSHILGHSSVQHYVNNFMYILLIGPAVEERYGSRNLLIMILTTALVIGLVNVFLFPGTALLGASGIVFMLIVLGSATNYSHGQIPLTMVMIALIYIGNEVYKGITQQDTISQLAHIIGGIMGIIFVLIMPKYRKS